MPPWQPPSRSITSSASRLHPQVVNLVIIALVFFLLLVLQSLLTITTTTTTIPSESEKSDNALGVLAATADGAHANHHHLSQTGKSSSANSISKSNSNRKGERQSSDAKDPVSSTASSALVIKQQQQPRLHIVYLAYLGVESWQGLVTVQLDELNEWGLATFATSIHVVFTVNHSLLAHGADINRINDVLNNRLELGKSLVAKLLPHARVYTFTSNEYEYRGIKLVYDLAHVIPEQEAFDSVILYFHAKVRDEIYFIRKHANFSPTQGHD